MTGRATVIGVDPGPISGIAVVDLPAVQAEVCQCTSRLVVDVVRSLVQGAGDDPVILAVERFVVGSRAARSASAHASQTTRDLVGELTAWCGMPGVKVVLRTAAEVKPWATDERLRAAGLWVRGMPHARDGCRHALFAAVHDAGLPDPLSQTFRIRHRSPR